MATFSHTIDNFFNTMDQRIEKPLRVHLKNVYSCLALSLGAAAVGAYIHVLTNFFRGSILFTILSVAMLLALHATPDNGNNEGLRFGYLMAFAKFFGLGTGPILNYAFLVAPSVLVSAFFGTSVIFGCFTVAAMYAPNRKFLYLGGVLASCAGTMIWMEILNIVVGSKLLFQINLYAGLFTMCAFVLYDTQLIIEKRRRGDADYIWHTVEFFIDFFDIFRRFVIILITKEDASLKKKA